MRIERAVRINAPIDQVWTVLTDVTHWPEWTESMTSVERLERSPLGARSRTRIKQPGLAKMTWTVSEFSPPHAFTWEAHLPGLALRGTHELHSEIDATEVRLIVEQRGILGRLLAPIAKKRSSAYVEMEAAGLKRRVKSAA